MRKCRYKQFIFYPFSKLRGFIPGKYCFSLCYTNARLPLKRNLFPRKWIRAWMHALVGSGRGQGLKILIPQRFFVLPSHKWTYVNTSQSHVRWDKQIYSWNLTSCSAAVLPADIYIISYNLIHSCRRTNFTAAMWIFHYPISRGSYHLKDPWFLISRLGGLSSTPGFLVRGWARWLVTTSTCMAPGMCHESSHKDVWYRETILHTIGNEMIFTAFKCEKFIPTTDEDFQISV